MNIEEKSGTIIIKGIKNLSLKQTFECGQCFRFNEAEDESYVGVAMGKSIRLRVDGNDLTIFGATKEDVEKIWIKYLDLERDYGKIIESFSFDVHLHKAAQNGSGIRILAQDSWETLCSFIISQNNNIPRIKKIIDSLCTRYGELLPDGQYSFPSASRLASLSESEIGETRCGFRAKYILDAARQVDSGAIDLEQLKKLDEETARLELKKIKGVGDKVASCVLLFGLGYLSSFPVDVWMKRVLDKYYPADFSPTVFGEYAGIAQQYLFYFERG